MANMTKDTKPFSLSPAGSCCLSSSPTSQTKTSSASSYSYSSSSSSSSAAIAAAEILCEQNQIQPISHLLCISTVPSTHSLMQRSNNNNNNNKKKKKKKKEKKRRNTLT
jgi:hypothetical protein